VERPIPVPCAHDRKYWEAAKEGILLLQRATATGIFQTYPRGHGLDAGGELEWVESPGRGTIHTFSVVYRSFYPALEAPYAVVVVDLDEGVKFMGHLVDCSPDKVAIGLPVELTFRELTDEISLPCFRPRPR
jgi:uncharacterized OB-fold protein